MREGDFIFLIITVAIILFYAFIVFLVTSFDDSNELQNESIEYILGRMVGALIIFVGVPWLIFNWVSDRKQRKKNNSKIH